MTKITSACEWCGKTIYFLSEEKERATWWKCDKCSAKVSAVEMNDCYEDIAGALRNGKWVIGKRVIHAFGSEITEFILFAMLVDKGTLRATKARQSIREALNDLFSNPMSKEDVKEFGFTFLQEMTPITDIKNFKINDKSN